MVAGPPGWGLMVWKARDGRVEDGPASGATPNRRVLEMGGTARAPRAFLVRPHPAVQGFGGAVHEARTA